MLPLGLEFLRRRRLWGTTVAPSVPLSRYRTETAELAVPPHVAATYTVMTRRRARSLVFLQTGPSKVTSNGRWDPSRTDAYVNCKCRVSPTGRPKRAGNAAAANDRCARPITKLLSRRPVVSAFGRPCLRAITGAIAVVGWRAQIDKIQMHTHACINK